MKVWVLLLLSTTEGYEIVAIYDTEEKAKQRIKGSLPCCSYEIEEWEVS